MHQHCGIYMPRRKTNRNKKRNEQIGIILKEHNSPISEIISYKIHRNMEYLNMSHETFMKKNNIFLKSRKKLST